MLDAVGEMDHHQRGSISEALSSEEEREEREERCGELYAGRDHSGSDRFKIGRGCMLKRPHRPFDQ